MPRRFWRRLAGFIAISCATAFAQAPAVIRGIVVDARGGEALANVTVQLTGTGFRANTTSEGRFQFSVPPAAYTLQVTTVGYHMVKKDFEAAAGETREIEVILTPDTLRQSETVQVQASPFETVRADSSAALVLAGNDAKNLGSVLADDPLRAVQNLPGVSSNNDFDARFSLRGANYDSIGLYLDGILLHEPFHTLEGYNAQGSATAFNGDLVEQMELHEGAWPQRFSDRTAGILDVRTREGSRSGTHVRGTASASNAGAMAEGPIGKRRKASWLAGARKSYLQYIFARTFPETTFIFGFEDAQSRLSYDLTSKQRLSFYVLESYSTLDRSNRDKLGINALAGAGYHYTLGNLGWNYTASNKLLLSAHAAWMREKYDNSNPTNRPLGAGFYGEWTANGAATWNWSAAAPLDAGFSVRRLRDAGSRIQYLSGTQAPRLLDVADGTAVLSGGFVQQSWTTLAGRLFLSAGARWDRHSTDRVTAYSPQASAALAVTSSTRLQFAWGAYAQYPEIRVLTSPLGSRALLPERSTHAIAALEQRMGERTRVRLEFYNRTDRDFIFQSLYEPRMANNVVLVPPANPPYRNALRGYSRGFSFFAQRSSANGLTGWISYAYGHTNIRDGVTGARFPADMDQRHTVNVYTGYRLRPSVNLSVRWSYGSGFPIPGYLTKTGTQYYLAAERNRLRMPDYMRLDTRINKSWTGDKWKFTLYGEVVNTLNRKNYLYDSFNGYNSRTGTASITLDTMFPILPSAGIVLER